MSFLSDIFKDFKDCFSIHEKQNYPWNEMPEKEFYIPAQFYVGNQNLVSGQYFDMTQYYTGLTTGK